MRETFRERGVIEDQNDNLVGLNLGYDFTAEHEQGIEPLQSALVIGGGVGIESLRIETFDASNWFIDEDEGVIGFHPAGTNRLKPRLENMRDPARRDNYKEPFVAQWGEAGFLLSVYNDEPKVREAFELLVEGYRKQNLALTLQGPSWVGGGLALIRPDQISDHDRRHLRARDHEMALLKKRAEQTGVFDLLNESDKGVYALKPSWSDRRDLKTDYSVIFFLNPREQDRYDAGWFTVEQLERWIVENSGSILKETA